MSDLDRFAAKLVRLEKDLTDKALLQAVGLEGKRLGSAAVQRDIGDLSLSNWRRNRPINLASRFDVRGDSGVEIGPNKRGRGPVRVLTDGRKAGTSRKGRPVSASTGKGTWDRARGDMEQALPKVAQRHTVQVLRKHFG